MQKSANILKTSMEWYILYTSEYFENSENSGIRRTTSKIVKIGINVKIWEARVRIARDKRTYIRMDK